MDSSIAKTPQALGLAFAAMLLAAVPVRAQAPPPLPPPRPFDLPVPGRSGPMLPVPRPAPQIAPPSPQSSAGADAGEAPIPPAMADPAPRPVIGAPMPPRRPAEAPLSNPEDEESEIEPWPRRTPGQRDLPVDPRPEPAPAIPANGITTDPGTSIACLPRELRSVLDALVQRYGGVHVTSTYRPAWRARRNSFHRRCQAVDLRVAGQAPRAVLEFVKTLPETGGHKVYWNGLVHVDTGPWRTW